MAKFFGLLCKVFALASSTFKVLGGSVTSRSRMASGGTKDSIAQPSGAVGRVHALRRVGDLGARTKVSGKKPLSVRGLVAATGVGVAELGHRQATGVAAALQGVDSALGDIGVA